MGGLVFGFVMVCYFASYELLVFMIDDNRTFMAFVVGEICVVHCGFVDCLFGRQ